MDELIPGVPDIFREVDVLLEDWLIDAKMTPEEDWQQVSQAVASNARKIKRSASSVFPPNLLSNSNLFEQLPISSVHGFAPPNSLFSFRQDLRSDFPARPPSPRGTYWLSPSSSSCCPLCRLPLLDV